MENNPEEQLKTLNQLFKESADVYSTVYCALGLSETDFWLLYVISHSDKPYTQMDFSNEWFYPIQTIHSAIAKLSKKGLISLEAISGTKNRKMIVLTEEGLSFSKKHIHPIDDIEKQAFSELSEEEREKLLNTLTKYIDNLKKGLNGAFNRA